jgi:hypothetical protein
MIWKAALCISAIGIVLAAQPSLAGVFTPHAGEPLMASSENTSTRGAAPHARARPGHHWRHNGGRHPFYGSGHRRSAN